MWALLLPKLERWFAIGAIALVLAAGAYFKGRGDEASIKHAQELEQANKVLTQFVDEARGRATADGRARQEAEEFIALIKGSVAELNVRFANVPQVVVDSRGCDRIAPGFRMQWNAADEAVNKAGSGADGAHR